MQACPSASAPLRAARLAPPGQRSLGHLQTRLARTSRGRSAVTSHTPAGGSSAVTSHTSSSSTGASPTSSSSTGASQDVAASHDGFTWTSYWYPVHALDHLDASKPHAFELLGKSFVLWHDAPSGAWRCFADQCPHRLAPLSEGRIEEGGLMCSYHGWVFRSDGRCRDIPQALDSKAKATACASSRSCAASFPVREAYGLVWVWPSAGPEAEAKSAVAHVPVSRAMKAAWEAARDGQASGPAWYRRLIPYGWDVLVENLADPAHLPFSHHGLAPNMQRSKAGSMPFSRVELPSGNGAGAGEGEEGAVSQELPDYCIEEQPPLAAFSYPASFTPGGVVSFTPPCSIIYESKSGFQTELLAVPAGPGRSIALTSGVSRAARVKAGDVLRVALSSPAQVPLLLARMAFQSLPKYVSHLQMNKLFDMDNVFLSAQDRVLASRGRQDWKAYYYTPVSCDLAIFAARRWADAALAQPLDIPGAPGAAVAMAAEAICLPAAAAAGAPPLSKERVNDRLSQHTQHCVVCQAALAGLQRRAAAARAAAGALFAAAVGLLAGFGLPALAHQQRAQAAGAIVQGVGSALGAAAALAAVAALLAAIARAASRRVQQFSYEDFTHAHNH